MKEQELSALKAELRAKYPGHTFRIQKTVGGDIVVFRSPKPEERDAHVTKEARGEQAAANRQLTLQVTVYPDRDAFNALLKQYPFLCETVSDGARDMGGFDADELIPQEVEVIVETQGLSAKYSEHNFRGLRKGDAVIVFRSPRLEERQSVTNLLQKKQAATALRQLAVTTAVYADPEVGALLERYPFLCDKGAAVVLDMGSGNDLGEF